jgi:hypothetical protein
MKHEFAAHSLVFVLGGKSVAWARRPYHSSLGSIPNSILRTDFRVMTVELNVTHSLVSYIVVRTVRFYFAVWRPLVYDPFGTYVFYALLSATSSEHLR